MELSSQDAERFFGEPALNIFDLIQADSSGHGMVNILAANELYMRPKAYATFLLWILSELFEELPEVGDLEKPRLVFFFDEAHLLFEDMPDALLDKIEQVVRLIRSKGVGVYFITQSPTDIPDKVLAQLGNRVQHALRAFTPRDQKAVKLMAQTFRPNPKINIEQTITDLGVGEALISFLDEKGSPSMVQRALICPPQSRIGAITQDERQAVIKGSIHYGNYEQMQDRDSAFEMLKKRAEVKTEPRYETTTAPRPRGRPADSLMTAMAKSTARSMGSAVGRQIIRGVLGSIFGSGRR
jgi:DNA helicase HerA-like ATPase